MSSMTATEIRAGASLAGVFGLRMLGLFLILPVFAVHAPQLVGGDNQTLVGLALGCYGLAQALLQIAFGSASDRWGRKPVIVIGLVIFAAGSFVAASATDIWTVIAGRTLQGAGAISSVVMALAADLTHPLHRTKVMAMIGATIGLSFAVSLVGAPWLYERIGMGGLFSLTGVLAFVAIGFVYTLVPEPPAHAARHEAKRVPLRAVLCDAELARLYFGIFALHIVQVAMFVVVPAALVRGGMPLAEHWKVYLPVVLASFLLMVPPVLAADRRQEHKRVLLGAVALMAVVQGLLAAWHEAHGLLIALLVAFFAGFNVLEAMLPSLASRIAPEAARGKAIGVFNTAQTLGLFCGGLLGGWVAKHFGTTAVFSVCAGLMLAWLVVAARMRPPAVNVAGHRALA
jgi:MFS family permease